MEMEIETNNQMIDDQALGGWRRDIFLDWHDCFPPIFRGQIEGKSARCRARRRTALALWGLLRNWPFRAVTGWDRAGR